MKIPNTDLRAQICEILPLFQKPGRYVGGEFNQVIKKWDEIDTKIALVFPDIYEIGLSNLGLAILYEIINNRKDSLAERVYCPWLDMEKLMRAREIPIFSLESMHPLIEFNIIGISIPYESLYTNVLNILDLAEIPLFSADRNLTHPLIIAGGNSTFNPEPMHQFIDAFVIGDGETIIQSIINIYKTWKGTGNSRLELLKNLAMLDGVYVPQFYTAKYGTNGFLSSFRPIHYNAPQNIRRQMVYPLPPSPLKFLVPNIDISHNRIPIEIMRGCTRGCRFCQAGIINRPVRERPVNEIIHSTKQAIKNTGFEEITLLSLSSSDYTQLSILIAELARESLNQNLTISLPSLRLDSFSVKHLDLLQGRRHGSFTFAPEAASDKMRKTINKPISSNQLFSVAREVFRHGWTTVKLYFMIGLPGETMEDIKAIVDLCNSVLAIGSEEIGSRAVLNISVNNFVPKPHTPFQWAAQENLESLKIKQDFLKKEIKNKRIKLSWSDNNAALLEACLSRGDRRISNVILDAWKNGAKFDAWQDQFNWSTWSAAFEKNHLKPGFYAFRERDENEIFSWDHIYTGVSKEFLWQEYQLSKNETTRPDCREKCYGCGIQTFYQIACFSRHCL